MNEVGERERPQVHQENISIREVQRRRSIDYSFAGEAVCYDLTTADKPKLQLEKLYKNFNSLIKITKKNDINILMGDFNAKIGKERVVDVIRNYGLDE